VFHPERFATSQRLLGDALPLLDVGLKNLDSGSLLVRNAISNAGLGMLRDVVQAAQQSLGTGSTAVPRVTPVLNVNLKAYFASHKNPRDMARRPLIFEEQCDSLECWSDTKLDTAFLDEYFTGSIDAQWEGNYKWADEDVISDAIEEASRNISRKFGLDY
jgi:hypothetical protein